MTGIAVVASASDAKFAQSVRAALQAAGLDASVSQSLPRADSPHVVLIWSATLEAVHAIDAQVLIGLWSEDRLVTVRRDETPLPLGLRDLPSLPPGSTAEEVCAAVPRARYTTAGPPAEVEQVLVGSMAGAATTGTGPTGSQEVELEFWRAIKDGNDPDDFELYVQQFPTGIYVALAKRRLAKLRGTAVEDINAAELEKRELEEAAKREAAVKRKLAEEKAKLEAQLVGKARVAKREAEPTKKLQDEPKSKVLIGTLIVAILAIAVSGGGAWYYFNKSSIEKQAALTAALESATKASQELQQAQARQMESLKALERARSAEDEARKAGDPEKLKEAQEATRRAEAEAAKQAEAVKQREAAAADARKNALESAEKAKSASKAVEAETIASVAKAPPVASAPVPVTKAPEPVAKAPDPVAEAREPVAKSPEPLRPKSRSERERAVDEDAARRPLASAQVKSAPSSAPHEAASAPSTGSSGADSETVYQQAMALEREGNAKDAVRLYRRAARAGSGKAALRLGEIYDKGLAGVSRDYAESLQWYETARKLGEQVPQRRERDESVAPVVVVPAPVVPESAKSEPAKSAVVKSAPAIRESAKSSSAPEPVKAVAPAPAPAAIPEPPKAAAPAPSPVPAPEAKPAAEPAAPAHETKTGWFTWRGLLIAIFVLALIAWRRSRRRQKAEARQAQRASAAANRKDAVDLAAARPAQRPQAAAQQAAPGDATLFVSYSHKDRDRVEPVVSVIEEMGRRVWMDRSDITGQTGWAGQIVRAIRECRAVVLMASPNSYTSDQVVRELYLAMNHRKTIVPIEIEPAEMPDELQYILAPFQHHRLSGRETREVLGRALAAV